MIIGFFRVDSPMVKSLIFGDLLGQLLEIGLDLAVVGQLPVRADLEAEEFLGRGLGREPAAQENERGEDQRHRKC